MRKQLAKFALVAAFGLAFAFTFGCSDDKDGDNPSSDSGSNPSSSSGGGIFNDDRDDGKPYKWVKIGEQIWMAENMNYDIPDDATDVCYDNYPANCTTYGRLYNWHAAQDVCPEGWRLPTDADWDNLMIYVYNENLLPSCQAEGKRIAARYYAAADATCPLPGKYLKAKSGWNPKTEGGSGNGTDKYGFAALPGGYRQSSSLGGDFDNIGNYGTWWSSDGNDLLEYNHAGYLFIDYNQDYVFRGSEETDALFSVRCLKDD